MIQDREYDWLFFFPTAPQVQCCKMTAKKLHPTLQSCSLMEWLTFCKTLRSLSFMTQMVLKIATFLWTRFTQITIPSFCTFPRTFKNKIFSWNHLLCRYVELGCMARVNLFLDRSFFVFKIMTFSNALSFGNHWKKFSR